MKKRGKKGWLRPARWGWIAHSWIEGTAICKPGWNGDRPRSMGFRKHLFRADGKCRRCGRLRNERGTKATLPVLLNPPW